MSSLYSLLFEAKPQYPKSKLDHVFSRLSEKERTELRNKSATNLLSLWVTQIMPETIVAQFALFGVLNLFPSVRKEHGRFGMAFINSYIRHHRALSSYMFITLAIGIQLMNASNWERRMIPTYEKLFEKYKDGYVEPKPLILDDIEDHD